MKAETHKKSLQAIQRTACLGITTPTAAMEVMMNLTPLDLFIESVAARSATRLKLLGCFRTTRNGHGSILGSYRDSIMNEHFDYTYKSKLFGNLYNTVIPSREEWRENRVILPNEISVYTEGSKMDCGTGSGFYCEHQQMEESFRLPDTCSVFQAEMLAIKKAAELLQSNDCRDTSISFYVDSQAALKALTKLESNTILVGETKTALNRLGDCNSIRLCWVPGHDGFEGNEKADELARKGSEKGSEHIILGIHPPLSHAWKIIEDETKMVWMRQWNSTETCRISKYFWPEYNSKKSKALLNYNRATLRRLVGILTGHCHLGKHARRMGLTNDDECRFCKDICSVEDSIHIVCECPALTKKRRRFLKAYKLHQEELCGLTIGSLKAFLDSLGDIDKVKV